MNELALQLMALQVGLPLALILLHSLVPAASWTGLWLRTAAVALLILYAALVGVWLFPPFWTPYLLAALLLLATLRSGRRLARRGATRRTWPRWIETGLSTAGAVVSLVLLAPALQGRAAPPDAVDLSMPLGPGTYLVANGGTSEAVNSHLMTLTGERFRPWRGESYGVDLIGIDRWGLTARGLAPRDPTAYVIYGAEILAPCSGTVVAAVDGIADMEVPLMDRGNMAGNHVLLSCGENAVLLGHMAPGSVAVGPGDEVATGDLLGRVGNTGNTNAPHLHIHVQRGLPEGAPLSGEPRWLTVEGRHLVRNDILTVPD